MQKYQDATDYRILPPLFCTHLDKEEARVLKKSQSLSPKKGGKEDQKRPGTARKRPFTAKSKTETAVTDTDIAFSKQEWYCDWFDVSYCYFFSISIFECSKDNHCILCWQ